MYKSRGGENSRGGAFGTLCQGKGSNVFFDRGQQILDKESRKLPSKLPKKKSQNRSGKAPV